jgi:hypothetical protein
MAQATTTTRRRAGRLTAMPRLTRVTLALALLVGAGGPTEGAMHHERQASVEEPGRPPAVATTEALPAAIGAWTRAGEAKRVGAGAIFDYMDGAGELYLAYRFDHLEVVEYRAGEGDEILVELYRMRGADDAFGLLSGDWGGEPVALGPAAPDGRPRALYGAGLLRLAAGGTYARVMATRETPASREAVLALGRAIAAGHEAAPAPRLVAALPPTVGTGHTLRRDSACFLRSHLVLNSAYFLSRQNILDLGPEVDAVSARYDPPATAAGASRVRVVLVAYPDADRARRAFDHFRAAYLPETPADAAAAGTIVTPIEDGWAGARQVGRALAIALECPDRATATAFLDAGLAALQTAEATHE